MRLFQRAVLLGWLLSVSQYSIAQTLNGIINRYTQVLGFDPCTGLLSVSDTAGFRPGMRILIHHTQGATVNTTNTVQYGTVTDLNSVGRLEWSNILSVSAGTFYLDRQLLYEIEAGVQVQAVTWPRFETAVVTDTLRPMPWNGLLGGILALEVTNNLILNAPILADGAGFRGGNSYIAPNNNCTWVLPEIGFVYSLGNWRGGSKGEGVATPVIGQELGRGAYANGGGGGNDHNSGGGGGANTAQGGTGGDNDEPTAFGCDGYFPGLPGKALSADTLRVYFGGGGGSGHCNNVLSSNGGNGGGLIVISAGSISGANGRISANGIPGQTSNGDGAGGGGAGGTVLLQSGSVPADLIVRAIGGNGGQTNGNGNSRCFGPGGGGGGGRLLLSIPVSNAIAQGGSAGTVVNSTAGCNGSTNDAAGGNAGSVQSYTRPQRGTVPAGAPLIVAQPVPDTVCAGQSAQFLVELTEESGWNYQWEVNSTAQWMPIQMANTTQLNVNNATSDQSGNLYRCRISLPGCGEWFSETAQLSVQSGPEPLFVLTQLNFGSYAVENQSQNFTGGPLWNLGDGTTSNEPMLVINYAEEGEYTIEMTVWNDCDTVSVQQTVSVLLPPSANFQAPELVETCNEAIVQFVNQSSGNAQQFTWLFEGGVPTTSTEESPNVTYTQSGFYEVILIANNVVGSDTVSRVLEVVVNVAPVANFAYTDLLNGPSVQFSNNSTDGLLYTWNFGDGTPVSNESAPLHVFPASGTYPVELLVVNSCGASILQIPVTVDDDGVATQAPVWKSKALLYPNPTGSGEAVLQLPILPDAVRLFDVNGRELWQALEPDTDTFQLNLQWLPAGLYAVQVIAGRELATFPLVKQ
jgi:PKD repeat protein